MEEEQKSENVTPDTPTPQLSAEEVIRRMEEATSKLDEATKKMEAQRVELEKVRVKAALAGQAEAGTPKQKLDETPEEYANRIMSGQL